MRSVGCGNTMAAVGLADAFIDGLERAAKKAAFVIPLLFSVFLAETLGLQMSPKFEAICDASDGQPIELCDEDSIATFGCKASELPTEPRRVVIVRAGGRSGKTSRMLAPKAIHAALTVPLPTLARGEHAWALIVAPNMTLAMQCLNFVRGFFEENDDLRSLVVNGRRRARLDESAQVGTATCITLRRPQDGKLVDIRVGVASSGGTHGRGKTLACALFDEAEFFSSESDKVVNDRDLFQACIQRVVPGGQLWMGSTPWIEGYGVMEEIIGSEWGRHEEALIAQGPTRALNPTWDPDYSIESHMRRTDPENAAREIDAIPLAAGSKLFFPPSLVEKCVNRARNERDKTMHLPPRPDLQHYAGTDLAFRKNSSALTITRQEIVGEADSASLKVRVVFHREEKPKRGFALKPSEVCAGFAQDLIGYRVFRVLGDIIYGPTAHEEFGKAAVIDPVTQAERRIVYEDWNPSNENVGAAFTRMRELMSEGHFEVPLDEQMLAQLRRVTSRPTPTGGVQIVLPRIGNSHGDVIMAMAIAVWQMPPVRAHAPAAASAVRGERAHVSEPTGLQGRRERKRGGPVLPPMGGGF